MTDIVVAGSIIPALLIAFAAGIVAFASPCVLPLAPGYLSYVTGLAGADIAAGIADRKRLLLGTSLFVLGFSVVFVSYGVLFGSIGASLLAYQDTINRVLGVIVIVMGLAFMGAIPGLQRDWRLHRAPTWSVAGAPLLGIVFGLGWTPCIGPALGAIMALSIDSASPWRGAALGFAYCIGLGIPFLLLALGLQWATKSVTFLKRHIRAINIAGGVMLMVIGFLIATGLWTSLMSQLQAVISGYVPTI